MGIGIRVFFCIEKLPEHIDKWKRMAATVVEGFMTRITNVKDVKW